MVADLLHELAFIYFVLAHGTDQELSGREVDVMVRKLQEWQPQLGEDQVRRVLASALARYGSRGREDALTAAISKVRTGLPTDQRMAALNDLVKIANADGVFLDDEEDLINRLLAEWEVDPYANYGQHGNKAQGLP